MLRRVVLNDVKVGVGGSGLEIPTVYKAKHVPRGETVACWRDVGIVSQIAGFLKRSLELRLLMYLGTEIHLNP